MKTREEVLKALKKKQRRLVEKRNLMEKRGDSNSRRLHYVDGKIDALADVVRLLDAVNGSFWREGEV